MYFLEAKANRFTTSFDGLQILGERLYVEILQELNKLQEENIEINDISFLAHSFGGLSSRVCIGVCEKYGIWERYNPGFYCCFGTSHIGVKSHYGGLDKFLQYIFNTKLLYGKSGSQLTPTSKFLQDISEPGSDYLNGLAKFKKRLAFGSTQHDLELNFYSSYISTADFSYREVDFGHYKHSDVKKSSLDAIPSCLVDLNTSKLLPPAQKQQRRNFLIGRILHSVQFYALMPLWLYHGLLSYFRVRNYKTLPPPIPRKTSEPVAPPPISPPPKEEPEIIRQAELKSLTKEERQLIKNLNSLEWEKYAVYIDRLDAHIDIVGYYGPEANPEGTEVVKFVSERVVEILTGSA